MMVAIEKRVSVTGVAIFRNLLLLGVYGFAVSLLLDVGTYRLALYMGGLGIAGALSMPSYPVRIGQPVLAMLGFGLIFLAQGWIVADNPIAGNFHWALAWFMTITTAVTLLPDQIGRRIPHSSLVSLLLALFVVAQIIAYIVKPKEPGLFSNIHYLALYSVVTLPVLYYLAAGTKSTMRWFFIAVMAGDLYLLMKTQSRPGYLALLAGSLAVAPFLAPRFRLMTLVAALLAPAALYFSGLFNFAARIDDLIINFAQEERPLIWRETMDLLARNSWQEWWFGHGLGQFYWDYQEAPSYHYEDHYASPHNYLLELLYSHGLTGLILLILAYGLFYKNISTHLSSRLDAASRRLGILIISITTAQLIIGFLTVPLFSRHNLYPLGLIVGVGLRYISDTHRHG